LLLKNLRNTNVDHAEYTEDVGLGRSR